MSDAGNAAAQAGGASGVDDKPPADGGADGGDDRRGSALDLSDDDGAGGGGDAGDKGASPWREDWRDALAGGDEAFGKRLKRFANPENFAKSYRELEKKFSAAQTPQPPAADATPEQIEAYRKQVGVPDTPDGYGLKFAEEFGATDADNGVLQYIANMAHAQHWSPKQTTDAFGLYQSFMKAEREGHAAATVKARAETQVDLGREYGAELRRNLSIADEFLEANGLGELLDYADLKTGRRVLHTPALMKAIITLARANADEEALVGGDVGGGGKSMDDEYRDLIKKSQAPGGKLTADEERRLLQLSEARVSREERQGRRRAA